MSWYIQDIYLSLILCFWIHVVWTLAGMECRWRVKKVVAWMWAEVTDSTVNEMRSPCILFLPGLTLFSLPVLTLENPFLFLLTAERVSGNHVTFPPYSLNILTWTKLASLRQIHFGHDVYKAARCHLLLCCWWFFIYIYKWCFSIDFFSCDVFVWLW